MYAIIYMEFGEVPRMLVAEHRFNYSLPRACFVCNKDLKLLEEFDKTKLCLDKIEFGKRNLRPLPETLYVALEGCNESHCQVNLISGEPSEPMNFHLPWQPPRRGEDPPLYLQDQGRRGARGRGPSPTPWPLSPVAGTVPAIVSISLGLHLSSRALFFSS